MANTKSKHRPHTSTSKTSSARRKNLFNIVDYLKKGGAHKQMMAHGKNVPSAIDNTGPSESSNSDSDGDNDND